MKHISRFPLIILFGTIVLFFAPFLFGGKLPIPADTIVGLYHPYRDLYAKDYPNGIPYKNFLITDPVRQQYPWRMYAIEQMKQFALPLWNPYNLGGTPLLANFQSAAFYPLNVLFFFLPFQYVWSLLVLLQMALAGLFLYLYLRFFAIKREAAVLGALAFSFSGFSIAWLEWNTIVHTAVWLPLILLAKEHLLKKISTRWIIVLMFAEVSQLFAGHLQVWFYSFLISNVYLVGRIVQLAFQKNADMKKVLIASLKSYLPFLVIGIAVFTITAVQWIPTLQFISLSARNADMANWQQISGWFLPWQHLVQFIAPDYFGNPATLNYWGEWNYGEFVGYIGIVPLLMACYALFFRFDKKSLFFGLLFFLSLVFSLPTFLAKMPFQLSIPFLSTAQPTRLMFVTDFSLAVLAALGFDSYVKNPKKSLYVSGVFAILFFGLWIFTLAANENVSVDSLATAKRNLIFPTIIFFAAVGLFILHTFTPKRIAAVVVLLLLVLTASDLYRFGNKFTPFTSAEYLFPQTKTLKFLSDNAGNSRILSTDSRIFPPNMSVIYRLQTVDGYDPLYLLQYGEIVAASERGKPDISQPFGFNRILTPQRVDSVLTDLMGVKYVVSLTDLNSASLKKVYEEGQTRVYEKMEVLPRAYFVAETITSDTKEKLLSVLFSDEFNPATSAVVESTVPITKIQKRNYAVGTASITGYTASKVIIQTNIPGEASGFLVLSDTYYPSWKVAIDGKEGSIVKTNYSFRGVYVPPGKHQVVFYNSLLNIL